MITLDATNESLEVVLAGPVVATQADFTAHYVDVTTTTYDAANAHGVTSGATPVTAVAAPGASTQRQIKLLTVHNRDTFSIALTVQVNFNGTTRKLWVGRLEVGETIVYTSGAGFSVSDVSGVRIATGPAVGAHSQSSLVPAMQQRVLGGKMMCNGTLIPTPNASYWWYIGYTTTQITVKHVECYVNVVGTMTQEAEIAIAAGTAPPNRRPTRLTILASDATLDDMVSSVGAKRNTTPLNCVVPAGTHLWAGIRTNFSGTEPTFTAQALNNGTGECAILSSSGDLTTLTALTVSPQTVSASSEGPLLRVTLD